MKLKSLILLVFLYLVSCDKKEQKYSKELQLVFDVHGGIDTWKNIKTISFSIDDKDVTIDLFSGKKVVNASTYSLGYDGENYWKSENSLIENPKEYIESISKAFLIPFSLANREQISSDISKKSIVFDDQLTVHYNSDYTITLTEAKDEINMYKDWQKVLGFKLPKLVNSNNKDIIFKNIQLSQAMFDDRFYQKPD